MSKRICNEHGLYTDEKCPQCHKANVKEYDKRRDKELVKFYNSKKWRETSKSFLKANPLCIECKHPAVITDHIEEIRDGGSQYDWENLQPMCRSCHNKKTAEERAKRGGGAKSLESKNQNTQAPAQKKQTPLFEGGGVAKTERKVVIDWESVKNDYENTKKSLRTLAKTYNVHHATISKKVKKEGWTRISQIREVTTTVTKEATMLPFGEAYSDEDLVMRLRDKVEGEWGLLFFDITYAEMKKKYWNYDYFALLLASNFYQDAMDARANAPENFLSETDKGDKYVSAEYNLHISATANFMKITKELGLNPLSRDKVAVKVVKKIKEGSLFDPAPKRERKIEF